MENLKKTKARISRRDAEVWRVKYKIKDRKTSRPFNMLFSVWPLCETDFLYLSQRRPSGIEKQIHSTGQAESAEEEKNIGTQIHPVK